MRRTKDPDGTSVSNLLQHYDTGESGEAYEIDVQTLPWTKADQTSALSNNSRALIENGGYSESGDAYEAEAEVSQQSESSS